MACATAVGAKYFVLYEYQRIKIRGNGGTEGKKRVRYDISKASYSDTVNRKIRYDTQHYQYTAQSGIIPSGVFIVE